MAKATKTGNTAVAGILPQANASGSSSSESPAGVIAADSGVSGKVTKATSDSGLPKIGTGVSGSATPYNGNNSSYQNSVASAAQSAYNNASGGSGGSKGSGGTSKASSSNGSTSGSSIADGIPASENPGIPASYSIGSDPNQRNAGVNAGAAETTQKIVADAKEAVHTDANVAPVDLVDVSYQRQLLKEVADAARDQATLRSDYAVSQGINELTRNLEDSKEQFQTMRNQVDADERQALDNQVLYAEARGDRGGIGASQYGAIQNTAAVNRLSVNKAQNKLTTDTARQISDLRAKGEFEKADKVLEIAQSYLGQLNDLYRYAQSTNVGIQEFNAGLSKWMAEYALNLQKFLTDTELSTASMSGAFSTGIPTQAAYQYQNGLLADAATALLQAGVSPTIEQLQALGMSSQNALDYLYTNFPYQNEVMGGTYY